MKIICIGRNYINHAKELNNPVPKEPVFFMKPDTALLHSRNPFVYPSFSTNVHHEVEIVVKINRLGKHIDEQFAHKYYNEISVGVDFTARDVQKQCKEKGLPWEKAKAFDKRKGYDLPIYAPASDLPAMYQSSSLPTTYVIDSRGNLALTHKGMADYDNVEFKNFLKGLK